MFLFVIFIVLCLGTYIVYYADFILSILFQKFFIFIFCCLTYASCAVLIYISTFCINLSILFLNFFIKLFSVYFYVFCILTFFLFVSILGKRKTSNVVYHIMFYHITSLYILNIQFLILCRSHQRLYYHNIFFCCCQLFFLFLRWYFLGMLKFTDILT